MLAFITISWALLLLQACSANVFMDKIRHAQEHKEYMQRYAEEELQKRQQDNTTCTSPSCYKFYNSKTKPYFIESWPDVNFDTGEFYGGSVPIDESDPSRTLFFIFKPAEWYSVKEVTIWLNGGPGCSSLEGFFEENGPILWQPGSQRPLKNELAWSKLTNMLWVEQPVKTGFAQGKVTANNEVDVAKDFVGFFENWQKLFGIKNYKIYITGESYAGRYVPYIGAQMLDQKDTTYFDFSGALMYDPCIGACGNVQGTYPLYYATLNTNEVLGFPPDTLAKMGQISEQCGWNAFLDTYLQYPPPGNQPRVPEFAINDTCSKIFEYYYQIYNINPCFNIYYIGDHCPLLWDVLAPSRTPPYFDRADVKAAIHAPANVTWTECSNYNVFVHGYDRSPDVNLNGGPLPQIIEATNRVLISNGDWDALLYTNGTLLAIQNMTWNGALGFQSAPTEDFIVPLSWKHYYAGAQGLAGKMHYERGLQWVEVYQSGHMVPQYQPRAAFRQLQWMLGRIPTL